MIPRPATRSAVGLGPDGRQYQQCLRRAASGRIELSSGSRAGCDPWSPPLRYPDGARRKSRGGRAIRRLLEAVVCLAGVLVAASSAGAHLIVGINDSANYEASVPSFFMPTMQSEGLTVNALTLRWDDTQPTTIDPVQEPAIASVIQSAANAGVTIELDLYPLHSEAFTGGNRCAPSSNPEACGNRANIAAFAAWTAMVAQTFPTVHEFIVMNECNQPLFVNPQWNSAGGNQSAEICGRALAAAYDALKAVNPENFVWGVGLSPRGNDNPNAASNSSTSPVHFLVDLGTWFKAFARATGRTAPLMDGLDFHPYPVPQSIPLTVGYRDPNDASVSNLPRIYQAFYDGFAGSPQRTIGQQPGGGLPVSLNEMGIQTDETGAPGYTGVEVSANAAGGVLGKYATQVYQATYYREMLNLLACDPNVRLINIFRLVDEPDLEGWQSGLYEVGAGTPVPKLSAAAVQQWIASSGGACQGKLVPWRPAVTVTAVTALKLAKDTQELTAIKTNLAALELTDAQAASTDRALAKRLVSRETSLATLEREYAAATRASVRDSLEKQIADTEATLTELELTYTNAISANHALAAQITTLEAREAQLADELRQLK